MAEKIYTPKEIDDINLGRKAVIGKDYKDTRGYTFIGVEENKLRLKDSASNIVFTPTTSNVGTSVQEAIEGINVLVQKDIYFNTDSEMYVAFEDKKVRSNSLITAYITVDSARDTDELELVDFTCTATDIVAGVGYNILVVDNSMQAEDKYVLNVIRN